MEELLADRGENLSPEERHSLQGALTRLKEQYSALKDSATATLSEVDTAINTTVQQNTQRVSSCLFRDFLLFMRSLFWSHSPPFLPFPPGKGCRGPPGDQGPDRHSAEGPVLHQPTRRDRSWIRSDPRCHCGAVLSTGGRLDVTHRGASGLGPPLVRIAHF